ncbi:MAG: DUF1731 domain-containing protein [Owenweeksia sp.]|nr:DUF1731 domain-containing protein [Owenweeksia sp.]
MARPVRWGLGAALGNGRQWLPWIHLQDVAAMFVHALENENMKNAYNFVGTSNVTNEDMTKAIAKTLHRPLWLPKVPGFALQLALGEMARVVLISNKVSNQKIANTGFEYRYKNLEEALAQLL